VIVVDTNVMAYLFLESIRRDQAEKVRAIDPEWAAPPLWRSEFRNVLAIYLRQGLLSIELAVQLAQDCESMMAGKEYPVSSARVLRLVAGSRCSSYDCEFVALAQELGVKLVTADKRVISEFPQTAIALDAFGR
jgi:predicted nucleic acid-binding protein